MWGDTEGALASVRFSAVKCVLEQKEFRPNKSKTEFQIRHIVKGFVVI